VQTARSITAEIKSRGQLTIPKKIRVMSRLEEGQVVSIIPVGDSVIITPKKLELDEARREIKKVLKAAGLSAEDLLVGLKEEREKLYQETYGKKSRQGFPRFKRDSLRTLFRERCAAYPSRLLKP
jgi:bifunctional DNA-binding transcriptional regulator/antitoxin component of YhaV-PrlF toxin-antitoxin module